MHARMQRHICACFFYSRLFHRGRAAHVLRRELEISNCIKTSGQKDIDEFISFPYNLIPRCQLSAIAVMVKTLVAEMLCHVTSFSKCSNWCYLCQSTINFYTFKRLAPIMLLFSFWQQFFPHFCLLCCLTLLF